MSFLKEKFCNIIDNKQIKSELSFSVKNPLTNKTISKVSSITLKDVKTSIISSHNSFIEWKKLSIKKRAYYLLELSKLIKENINNLAELIVLEQGKAMHEALSEINYANSFITSSVHCALSQKDELITAHFDNKQGFVYSEPYGVVGCITPWNFPAAMITRKIAPALITGNTVILKPSELTPLTALAIGELAIRANFPKGILNIICGEPKMISDELLKSSLVKKISFTGSTKVGKSIISRSHETVTKLSLELGGHAPFIVFEDADIDNAVDAALKSKFRNNGQTCICANRFYIHTAIYNSFLKKLKKEINKLQIGNGLEKNTDMGPLINKQAIEKIEIQIKDAQKKGAKIELGGGKLTNKRFPSASFFEPTIITNCNAEMKVFQEETFGPVCAIKTFNSDNEVINEANNSIYGLAAYVFTSNLKRSFLISKSLNFGIIGINDGSPSHSEIPFGGFNQSGIGKEGGSFALAEYTQKKYVSLSL